MDEYFASLDNKLKRVYVIIYDIVSNKTRYQLAKLISQFGFRIQKSAFEVILTQADERELVAKIDRLVSPTEDLVRMYRLCGNDKILSFGNVEKTFEEEVVII